MIFDIKNKFKKNIPQITILKTGYVYEDEKGIDYIFIGYGGYNILVNGFQQRRIIDNWGICNIIGKAPYVDNVDYTEIKEVYIYLKLDKCKKEIKEIPQTYEELLQKLAENELFEIFLTSEKPRKFVKEKECILNGYENINKNPISNSDNSIAFAFNFTK